MPVNTIMAEDVAKNTRKSKLDKICELEGCLRLAREENRRLQKNIKDLKKGAQSEDEGSEHTDGHSLTGSSSGANEEKLKEALRAFKRVTIQQEMSLTALRAKSRQRRKELENKNEFIENLQDQIQSLQKAYEKLKESDSHDLADLRSQVADLQLQLAQEDTKNEQKTKELRESKQDITTLRDQLQRMRGQLQRNSSLRSIKSMESGSSMVDDVAKLKKELAIKTEKIAMLEFELETAREKIYELKERKQLNSSFPTTPAPGVDDFFSDEEEEEDEFWESG